MFLLLIRQVVPVEAKDAVTQRNGPELLYVRSVLELVKAIIMSLNRDLLLTVLEVLLDI